MWRLALVISVTVLSVPVSSGEMVMVSGVLLECQAGLQGLVAGLIFPALSLGSDRIQRLWGQAAGRSSHCLAGIEHFWGMKTSKQCWVAFRIIK